MKRTRWVVRIENNPVNGTGIPRDFLECLRYAGIAKPDHGSFDLYAPKGVGDEKVWADQNANRMKSYAFKAEAIKIEG